MGDVTIEGLTKYLLISLNAF